jgi:phenylalanyl-tRNA synthetase alpha chain
MRDKLQKLKQEVLSKLEEVKTVQSLKNIELKYFSRKGELSSIMHQLKNLNPDFRKEMGILANQTKKELEAKMKVIKERFGENNQFTSVADVTLPGEKMKRGHLHPITIIQRELEDLFSSLGFMIVDGPELESDYYNFTALNVPPLHPARDMHDTFYVSSSGNNSKERDLVMRTHTSPVQIRAMKKFGAPLKAIIPGRCFRNEATDSRHEHTFYQFEGLMIGRDINFSNVKSLLEIVGEKIFGPGTKLRTRPKFYPFVEPGNNGEYTCFLCGGKGCRVCKNTGWLEIVGAGLIHPDVLKVGGIDPEKYSGLAFGFGLTRLAMLKYAINDVRLFNSGDLKFLEQF